MLTINQGLTLANCIMSIRYGNDYRVTKHTFTFYWSDDLPVFEYLVVGSSDPSARGYILIAASQGLPPLVSESTSGYLLSELLIERSLLCLEDIKDYSALDDLRIYIISPWLFMARTNKSYVEDYLADLQSTTIYTISKNALHQQLPSDAKTDKAIALEWDRYQESKKVDQEPPITRYGGPYYRQNCKGYSVKKDSGATTCCKPFAKVGCAPVGWATWGAFWKVSGKAPKLFESSNCWLKNWPSHSCGSNPSQCVDVYNIMWRLHEEIDTDVNGNTGYGNVHKGSAILDWGGGLIHTTGQEKNISLDRIRWILGYQAFLYTGLSNWTKVLLKKEPIVDILGDGPAKSGHTIVCHGIREHTIYLNLGWGVSHGSTWWNYHLVSDTLTDIAYDTTKEETPVYVDESRFWAGG